MIDTIGFNTESTVGGGGDRHQPFRHSEDLHMVERIRRINIDTDRRPSHPNTISSLPFSAIDYLLLTFDINTL